MTVRELREKLFDIKEQDREIGLKELQEILDADNSAYIIIYAPKDKHWETPKRIIVRSYTITMRTKEILEDAGHEIISISRGGFDYEEYAGEEPYQKGLPFMKLK